MRRGLPRVEVGVVAVFGTIAWFVFFSLEQVGFARMAIPPPSVKIVAVRGAEALAKQISSENPGFAVAGSTAKEFANGNTFVRIEEDITAETVWVVLPESLNADVLMESLITVFTARHMRASEVIVIDPIDRKEIKLEQSGQQIALDFHKLLSVAGANEYRSLAVRSMVELHRTVRDWPSELLVERGMILGDDHPALRENLAKEMNLPVEPNRSIFETPSFKRALVFYIHSSAQPVNWNFFKMLYETNALAAKGATVSVVTPYLPYARSDKVDQRGVAVTGHLVSELIEAHGADSSAFVRAHAPQSEGFFNIPTFHAHGRDTINAFLRDVKIDAVVGPDNGSGKEIALHAKELGVFAAVINKARNPETSEIEIVGISTESDLTGKTVAVIDDETASGKTLAEAAHYLKTHGVKDVYVVVTSLTGNAKAAIESKDIRGVTVTDNVPIPEAIRPHVHVLSVAGELARKLAPLRKAVGMATPVVGCSSPFVQRKS